MHEENLYQLAKQIKDRKESKSEEVVLENKEFSVRMKKVKNE